MLAKPTLYGGVNFRSRLEAQWAVFMHEILGWNIVYEEQSINGYIPDFVVYQDSHLIDILYIEVKGAWDREHVENAVLKAESAWEDHAKPVAVVGAGPTAVDGAAGLYWAEDWTWLYARFWMCDQCQNVVLTCEADKRCHHCCSPRLMAISEGEIERLFRSAQDRVSMMLRHGNPKLFGKGRHREPWNIAQRGQLQTKRLSPQRRPSDSQPSQH